MCRLQAPPSLSVEPPWSQHPGSPGNNTHNVQTTPIQRSLASCPGGVLVHQASLSYRNRRNGGPCPSGLLWLGQGLLTYLYNIQAMAIQPSHNIYTTSVKCIYNI
ncbi:hypothetical protein J4Q44_G00289140 [Coregonus suidteri]|uniref:Uncharacterized protein n=1 Tax=Coregonus suidteri TaxID=861788 RepID=A0AAN8QJ55_9TELE